MTIDEAIKILSTAAFFGASTHDEQWYKALGLGIEALKRFKKMRQGIAEPIYWLFPGETKE